MKRPILLTGATGYIGGRLLAALEGKRRPIRCLVREPGRFTPRRGAPVEVVKGDVLRPRSLKGALQGIHTAYYLIHSMGSSGEFEDEDRLAASNFAKAASAAGVQRIIYLGGLGETGAQLSRHLESRQEVGEILRSSSVQVVEFRASIVIGSGSLSFEMMRALVDKLPVMVTPRWVSIKSQPIYIDDLLGYLVGVLGYRARKSRIFEIGGKEQVSYGDLMQEYARQRGLLRLMIPVPVLTPHLSSLWLELVTPRYATVGRKLIDSLRNPTVVRDPAALDVFQVRPRGFREAISAALGEDG